MILPEHLAATPTLPRCAHGLPAADLSRMFELMLTARTVDRRLQALYRQGKVHGGVYSQEGNEAVSVGTAWALEDGDCLFPMHRGLGARLTRGDRLPVILAQLLGRASGPTSGRDSGLHHDVLDRRIFAMISHLGTQLPVACGAALAMRLAGETDRVAASYTGDGATALGDFHEGLNMAAVMKLPVILVVENNLYAYSTPNEGEFACATLAERGPGYGIAAETVDGTDVLATYLAMRRAVARARRGEGPTLLEARALRLRGHSEADAHEYVPKEQLEEGRRTEPLARFERYLREEGRLDDDSLEALKARVQADVESALEEASALPAPDGADLRYGVYSEEGHPSRGRGVPGIPGLAGAAFRGRSR